MTGPLSRYATAFDTLGLLASASPADLERAYRRAAATHPPDRDPEGFVRVREAFELLTEPEKVIDALLVPRTGGPLPALQPPPAVAIERELPLAALRALVADIDAAALLPEKR